MQKKDTNPANDTDVQQEGETDQQAETQPAQNVAKPAENDEEETQRVVTIEHTLGMMSLTSSSTR